MQIKIIFNSFLLFLIVILFHIFIWRIFKPQKHIILLFTVFIALPLLFFAVHFIINLLHRTNQNFLLVALLYFALAGVYIQTYPAVQGQSPSLLIVYLIGHKKNGADINNLRKKFNEDTLIKKHVYNLETENLITISKTDDSISLTAKGKIIALIFILYRKLLGLKVGEG